MNRLFIIAVFISFLSAVQGQTSASTKILGRWYSKKTYHTVPVRTLIFTKDSIFNETVWGSLGNFTIISKYYFIDSGVIVLNGIKSKIIFLGENKLKFLNLQNDSTSDLLYKLKFIRL